jgi:hypothetical protein
LTIHAEAEGINCLPLFEAFLDMAQQQEIILVPLGDLLTGTENIDSAAIKQCVTAGRDGWISCQDGTYPGIPLNSKVLKCVIQRIDTFSFWFFYSIYYAT